MADPLSFDILVVGAGPAGAKAATAAAEAGARTLLVDRKMRIGEEPHCGEFVPARLFTEFSMDTLCVHQAVEFMETRVAPLRISRSASPGFIIDRVRFDRDLSRKAAEAGVTVMSGSRLVRREGGSWILKSSGDYLAVNAAVTIAADGAASSVANSLGLARPEVLLGIQQEVPLVSKLRGTFVFLDKDFVGGYGWLFPKGTTANVGIGTAPGAGLRPAILLERFLERLRTTGMIRSGRLALSSGLIAVSGMRENLVVENVLFCGDAAGLTHPITGAGIPQAVISGELAGRTAAASVKNGTDRFLAEYEEEVRSMYQGVLSHARAKRVLMMEHWHDADFEQTCEQTWIAFKGYRKRVRR
jgi:digeranylgeranylglycerophospholipid reductase